MPASLSVTSARLATEEALRAHQADMLSLIETVDGFVWSIDRAYRLTASNTAFRRIISESLGSELKIGESIFNLTGEQGNRQWRDLYDRALHGESFSIDIQRVYGDKTRWVRYRFNSVRDHDGKSTGVTIIGRDITEERRAAQVIQDQLAEIALVYDTAPIGLAVLDTDLRYQRVNRLLAAINGVSPEGHIGRTVADIAPFWRTWRSRSRRASSPRASRSPTSRLPAKHQPIPASRTTGASTGFRSSATPEQSSASTSRPRILRNENGSGHCWRASGRTWRVRRKSARWEAGSGI